MRNPIGVSILTNKNRLEYLQTCVLSLLENCFYRPLIIGIHDNGSTDGTRDWCKQAKDFYGVEFRVTTSETDQGCASGTNMAASLVRDCEYVLQLESDFVHLPAEMSGEDKMWLNRAVAFMDSSDCDYLYLRRMVNEESIRLHWWDRWAEILSASDRVSNYMRCPGFRWSNNPHLRRNDVIYEAGCLPVDEENDGPKGTPLWSQPELKAPEPPRAWVHRWGLFVHDVDPTMLPHPCGKYGEGYLSCKYGFFKDGGDHFCQCCRGPELSDMKKHYGRYRGDE